VLINQDTLFKMKKGGLLIVAEQDRGIISFLIEIAGKIITATL